MGADTSVQPSANETSDGSRTAPRSAKVAWYVISGAIALGIVMGFMLFFRAKDADIALRQWMLTYAERGQSLSAEQCVDDALAYFHDGCEAPIEMCIQAIPMGVAHCLKAKDRSADCAAIGTQLKDEHWTYEMCKRRGIEKGSKKPLIKACTAAWDAYDSFCRSGQKKVAL